MNISKPEILDKLHNEKLLIGFDLGNEYSLISYCFQNSDSPETASYTAGGEQYSIPTAMCKRREVGQWFYGREAVKYAEEEDGILIDNLLKKAYEGREIIVEDTPYDPVAILTLFIRRSLGILTFLGGVERIGAFMVTCETLDQRMVEVLSAAVSGLNLKTDKIFFQNHMESFYYYMLNQPAELWAHQVLLCDFSGQKLFVNYMERNLRTTPVVIYIDSKEFPEMGRDESSKPDRDLGFLDILRRCCDKRIISSIFLIGDGFKDDWMKESLRYACEGRRVFRGNNLYSKGACMCLREKLRCSDLGKNYVFLGRDKLKANIGMQVLRRGEESYLALLDAGLNWYEAKKTTEFITERDNKFELTITPLNGKNPKLVEINLDNLPRRPDRTTRLLMQVSLKSPNILLLDIKDEGFGEIFPSSGLTWQQEIEF